MTSIHFSAISLTCPRFECHILTQCETDAQLIRPSRLVAANVSVYVQPAAISHGFSRLCIHIAIDNHISSTNVLPSSEIVSKIYPNHIRTDTPISSWLYWISVHIYWCYQFSTKVAACIYQYRLVLDIAKQQPVFSTH